jgi:hypothetical protein
MRKNKLNNSEKYVRKTKQAETAKQVLAVF